MLPSFLHLTDRVFIAEIVIIFSALYLERNICTKVGGDGISVSSGRKNMVKWMYAQAIGPKIMIKTGISVIILTVLFDICALHFKALQNIVSFMPWIVLLYILGSLFVIDNKVAAFSPEWLSKDKEKEKNWVDTAVEFARKRQYKELYEFATSTK